MEEKIRDINRPHTAIVSLSVEISPLLNDGQVSGEVIKEEYLKTQNLNSHKLFFIEGYNLQDCIEKLRNSNFHI